MTVEAAQQAVTVNGTTHLPSTKPTSSVLDTANFPQKFESEYIHISLTYNPLDAQEYLRFTRSPTAGANVLFLGTTRNNFDNRPVSRLSYSAYPALALKSLHMIAEDVRRKHSLEKVAIVHRLGEVKVGEESIAVAVSSGHRAAGWAGAEEILERVKARAEIWKREWFADTGEVEEGVWRANKHTDGHGNAVP
jgi:molybdopterin synthase catalytic subunit